MDYKENNVMFKGKATVTNDDVILTYLGEFSCWHHRCEQTPGPISPIDELIVF